MLTQPRQQDIRTVARRLWEDGVEAEPAIQAAYLFPSPDEIRLVYLDPTTAPNRDSQTIRPYYFGANAASDLPYPSAIALIRPEEKDRLEPPDGWGTWAQAELVWES
jgi:hypothetical protein